MERPEEIKQRLEETFLMYIITSAPFQDSIVQADWLQCNAQTQTHQGINGQVEVGEILNIQHTLIPAHQLQHSAIAIVVIVHNLLLEERGYLPQGNTTHVMSGAAQLIKILSQLHNIITAGRVHMYIQCKPIGQTIG